MLNKHIELYISFYCLWWIEGHHTHAFCCWTWCAAASWVQSHNDIVLLACCWMQDTWFGGKLLGSKRLYSCHLCLLLFDVGRSGGWELKKWQEEALSNESNRPVRQCWYSINNYKNANYLCWMSILHSTSTSSSQNIEAIVDCATSL